MHEHIFYFRKYLAVTLARTCTCLIKHRVQPEISFHFENVEKSYTFCPLSHSVGTVLRDPLSYVTFSLRSLEGSHMTVSTVLRCTTFVVYRNTNIMSDWLVIIWSQIHESDGLWPWDYRRDALPIMGVKFCSDYSLILREFRWKPA